MLVHSRPWQLQDSLTSVSYEMMTSKYVLCTDSKTFRVPFQRLSYWVIYCNSLKGWKLLKILLKKQHRTSIFLHARIVFSMDLWYFISALYNLGGRPCLSTSDNADMKLFQKLPFSLSTLSSAAKQSNLFLIPSKSKGNTFKIFEPLGVLLWTKGFMFFFEENTVCRPPTSLATWKAIW